MDSTHRRTWLRGLLNTYADGDIGALAGLVKMNRTPLSLMLNGRRTITDKTVVRICNRLKVEPPASMQVDLPRNETKQAEDQPTTDLSAQLAALNNSINGLLAANVILAQQVQAALAELSRLRKQQSDPKGQ